MFGTPAHRMTGGKRQRVRRSRSCGGCCDDRERTQRGLLSDHLDGGAHAGWFQRHLTVVGAEHRQQRKTDREIHDLDPGAGNHLRHGMALLLRFPAVCRVIADAGFKLKYRLAMALIARVRRPRSSGRNRARQGKYWRFCEFRLKSLHDYPSAKTHDGGRVLGLGSRAARPVRTYRWGRPPNVARKSRSRRREIGSIHGAEISDQTGGCSLFRVK